MRSAKVMANAFSAGFQRRVSRELRRNAATRGGKPVYRAAAAQWKAQEAAKRPKVAKMVANPRLRDYVQDRLAGQVRGPDGTIAAGPATQAWKGRAKPHRADRRWSTAWSRNRSLSGSRPTSRRMSPCASMQRELLDQHQWQTVDELGGAIFEWIEAWYNPRRRHTSLGMLAPAEFEPFTPPPHLRHDHQTQPVRSTGSGSELVEALLAGGAGGEGLVVLVGDEVCAAE